MKKIASLFIVIIQFLLISGVPVIVTAQDVGKISIIPTHLQVKELTTLQITYTAGKEGIKENGVLKINLPKEWFKNEFSKYLGIINDKKELLFPINNMSPFDDGTRVYLTAKTYRKDVKTEVSLSTIMVNGEDDYINRTFVIKIVKGKLMPGDKITITFGERMTNSGGTFVPYYASNNDVMWSVDPNGSGIFSKIQHYIALVVFPGPPYEINVFVPSNAVIGDSVKCSVVVLDKNFNAAEGFNKTVKITCSDTFAVYPQKITFNQKTRRAEFYITFRTAGIQNVTISDNLGLGEFSSNPVLCTLTKPAYSVFWGEMHSHDKMSQDGRGNIPFLYARDVSCLDFYAPSNHSNGMSVAEWQETITKVKKYDNPHHFATILGFECSIHGENGGHNNVYYRGDIEPYFVAKQIKTVTNLYKKLEGIDAIAVPHHTAIEWAPTNWSLIDDKYCRVAEIYSNHGACEEYDPMYPLSYEHMFIPGNGKSVTGKHWLRDAWAMGHKFGVIASSDDHRGQPGREHAGLAAVLAKSLTREDIYDAIKNRRTYATTGARMLIDFTVDGEPMGSEIISRSAPKIKVSVYGTDEIEFVELFKLNLETGNYETLYRENPQKKHFESVYTDDDFKTNSMYYVRVTQSNMIRERPVRGWSSPVWVTKRND